MSYPVENFIGAIIAAKLSNHWLSKNRIPLVENKEDVLCVMGVLCMGALRGRIMSMYERNSTKSCTNSY